MKLLVATNNHGKIKELKELLRDLPVNLKCLNDFENIFEAQEIGETFAENAVLKANSYALQTGVWSLSDDSGLEVEALNGAPGVFSARYAGENATDEDRIIKLLNELNQTKDESRRARFVCAMAVADEKGEIKFLTEGICDGTIGLKPCGVNGFGYDPIFVPDGFKQTFGELSPTIKRKISHRARAIEKIMRFLRGFTTLELDQ
ncbi:MAG: XTP/dITP diphosphatase [Actinomycetota bacterium]